MTGVLWEILIISIIGNNSFFIISAEAFQSERWLPPLNDIEKIRLLCTEQMHKHIIVEVQQMRDEEALARIDTDRIVPRAPIMGILRHYILCRKNYTQYLTSGRKYEGIIWFMRSLDFCDINRFFITSPLWYHRDFQVDMLRAGFALVCQKTDDIGKYQLSAFADLFRIIYEKTNVNRPIICNRLLEAHQDLYGRCHVDSTMANFTIAQMRCSGEDAQPLIKLRAFFSRFSRNCQTLAEFYQHGNLYDSHLGEALANDTVFMNMLSGNIKRTVISYSLLPHLVLKTRLLLQHFPLAAIKLKQMIENGRKCRENDSEHINLETADSSNSSNFSDHNITSDEDCRLKNIDDINSDTADDFVKIGEHAALGIFIEILLLGAVVFNTVFLSILLHQTKDKLSTATILFIFNILFSNALFVASFVCMFSDFYVEDAYGEVTEDQFYQNSASLIIAETLQTHLFAQSEFLKHLIQETLFSLAQNGSLLGLTHLLVLVLVVINKSMSGKAIRLSRRCVILVFAFVWVFLIFTHLIFSALQFSAIQNLDNMFNILQSNPGSLNCSR
uniref:G-protein coupled receptors family 1 profile domain-containing protein n=1 Tax=Panagrolaimus davidi TaxID=227884 RepID=A0A914Q8G5_9BILA